MREARRSVEPADHVVEADAREDRNPVPGDLAVSSHLVAAVGDLLAEQLGERIVRQLRLLKADDIRPALVQPRQKPRHPLLERVDIPGRDAHGPSRYPPSEPADLWSAYVLPARYCADEVAGERRGFQARVGRWRAPRRRRAAGSARRRGRVARSAPDAWGW